MNKHLLREGKRSYREVFLFLAYADIGKSVFLIVSGSGRPFMKDAGRNAYGPRLSSTCFEPLRLPV
jgi:hypothetical protein